MYTPIYNSLTKEQKDEVLNRLPVFGPKLNGKQLEALFEIVAKSIKESKQGLEVE